MVQRAFWLLAFWLLASWLLVLLGCSGSSADDAGGSAGTGASGAASTGGGGAGTGGTGGSGGSAGSDGGGSNGVDYDKLFPTDAIVDVDLAISQESWDTLMADPMQDVYVPADLTYGEVFLPNVAVRFKGNSSRQMVASAGLERYSFKVDMDENEPGQKLYGVDKINLNNGFHDPSYVRERLTFDLFTERDVAASRQTFARLTKNGEPFGLYSVIEQVDKEFLREHFPDDSGNLYKPELASGDLTWRGDDFASYPQFELKTNEDNPDHTAIMSFLDVLNNTADGDFEQAIAEVFDVQPFLRWLAVNTALGILDSYVGSPHNYYLYEDRTTGLFVYIPWDVNGSYGVHSCGAAVPGGLTPDQIIALPYLEPVCGPPENRPLVTRILGVSAYRETYESELANLLGTDWSRETLDGQIGAVGDLVRADVAADPTAFYTVDEFDTNLHDDVIDGQKLIFGLTRFWDDRTASLESQGLIW